MKIFKKKVKKIPDGKYRVIKIGKDAIYELLREAIKDRAEGFFDVSDSTSIVTCFDIDWEKQEFICIARNEKGDDERLDFDIDTEELFEKLENTTDSVFCEDRYIELSEDE